MTIETQEFPHGDFYIKSAASPSGNSTTAAPAQNLVIDIERGGFGGFFGNPKTNVQRQKSNTDHDSNQLWRYDNGWLVNKNSNNVLEVEAGKPGNRLVLAQRKALVNANNQRWILTKEGHIALQQNPQLVLEIKGAVKDAAQILLADTSSKTFGKSSNSAVWVVIPTSTPKSANAIGVLRVEFVQAKDVLNVDNWVPGGKSDPYVRVFPFGSNNIIASTRVIDDDLNPVWNEVHYLPIKQINEKFIFELMDSNTFTKDKTLGKITFQVTDELVKFNKGVYVGTEKGIDRWEKLPKKGQLHYRAKFFPLSTLHQPGPDFLENLRKKPYDLSAFYTLLFHQEPNGSFLPSNGLANLFGLETGTLLVQKFKAECQNEKAQKLSEAVWVTSMVIWFLKLLLKDYQGEWSGVYDRAERYIGTTVNNLELEEVVFIAGGNAVSKLFNISLDQSSLLTRPSRKTVKVSHIRRTFQYQNSNGAFRIDDDLAKIIGFKNAEHLRTSINEAVSKRKLSSRITQLETHVWVTVFVLHYYRYVAIDHREIWINSYWSAYRWLWAQFGNKEPVEIDAFRVVKDIAINHYSIDKETIDLDITWEKEVSSQKKGQLHLICDFYSFTDFDVDHGVKIDTSTINIRHLFLLITLQRTDGSFVLNKRLARLFNFSSEAELITAFTAQISDDEQLKLLDRKVYTAVLVTSFMRILLWKHSNEWMGSCAKTEEWISLNINDEEVEERLYVASNRFVIDLFKFDQWESEEHKRVVVTTTQKTIITRRTVTIRIVRRFLSYQSETGSYEHNQKITELLGYESIDESKQHLDVHFSSYSKASKITEEDRKKLARKVEEESETKSDSIIGIIRLNIRRAKDLSKSSSLFTTTDPYIRIIDGSGKKVATTVINRSTRNPVWEEVHFVSVYAPNEKINLEIFDSNLLTDENLGHYTLDISGFVKQNDEGIFENGEFPESWVKVQLPNGSGTQGELQIGAKFFSTALILEDKFIFSPTTVNERLFYILISWRRPDNAFEFSYGLARFFNFTSAEELRDIITGKIITRKTITIRIVRHFLTYQTTEGRYSLNDKIAAFYGFESTTKFTEHLRKHFKSDRVKKVHIDVWVTAVTLWYMRLVAVDYRADWSERYNSSYVWLKRQIDQDAQLETEIFESAKKWVVERYEVDKEAIAADDSFVKEQENKTKIIEADNEKKIKEGAVIIMTRRLITLNFVKKYISFQKHDGQFTADAAFVKILGFESRKDFEQDINSIILSVFISSFLKTLLWKHRSEWLAFHAKTETWISESINDVEVEERVYAAVNSYVIKHYKILEKDESFKATLKITNETVSEEVKKQLEIDEVEETVVADVVNEVVVGVVKIKIDRAKDLLSGGFFQTTDPYVRILDAASKEIARTKVVAKTKNPVWEEVHFVSVHGEKDKITLEILDENLFVDDTPLGHYVLHLCELIKRNADGTYSSGKRLDKWEKVTRPDGKGTKGEIHIEAQFSPTKLSIDEHFVFSKDNVDISHLYTLISWRLSVGSFEATDNLARYFNFKTHLELIEAFKTHVVEKEVFTIDESFVSAQKEKEEVLEKVRIEEEKRLATIKIETLKTSGGGIFGYFARSISGGKTVEEKKTEVTEVKKKTEEKKTEEKKTEEKKTEEKKTEEKKVEVTEKIESIILSVFISSFLKTLLWKHRSEWLAFHAKTETWISESINDVEVEERVYAAVNSYVIKHYKILEKDESFKATLKITNETVSEEVKKQLEIDEVEETVVADVVNEVVVGVVKIKIDRAKDLLSGGFFQTTDPYVRILDAASKEIARTKVVAKTKNPVWEEVHFVSVHGEKDKITLEILDENLFVDDTPLGHYVLHLCELIKRNADGTYSSGKRLDKWEKVTRPDGKGTKGEIHIEAQFSPTKLSIDEHFVFSKDNVDISHLYTLISWRLSVGSFEATDNLARYFNFKTHLELIEAFKTHVVEKEVFTIDESFVSAQKEKEEVLEKVRIEEEKRLATIKIVDFQAGRTKTIESTGTSKKIKSGAVEEEEVIVKTTKVTGSHVKPAETKTETHSETVVEKVEKGGHGERSSHSGSHSGGQATVETKTKTTVSVHKVPETTTKVTGSHVKPAETKTETHSETVVEKVEVIEKGGHGGSHSGGQATVETKTKTATVSVHKVPETTTKVTGSHVKPAETKTETHSETVVEKVEVIEKEGHGSHGGSHSGGQATVETKTKTATVSVHKVPETTTKVTGSHVKPAETKTETHSETVVEKVEVIEKEGHGERSSHGGSHSGGQATVETKTKTATVSVHKVPETTTKVTGSHVKPIKEIKAGVVEEEEVVVKTTKVTGSHVTPTETKTDTRSETVVEEVEVVSKPSGKVTVETHGKATSSSAVGGSIESTGSSTKVTVTKKPAEKTTTTTSDGTVVTTVEEVIVTEEVTTTTEEGHLDSELIVSGAAYQALRKFKCQRNKVKTTSAYDKTEAVEKVSVYAKAEVDKLVAKNETHNKEEVSNRAVRVARFLLENYYDDVDDCKCFEKEK
ncbi:5634_t:CDS:10 [Paraglomus occultum]|uniref:5634_t:CDS:1 n=1 Tax=Paraglomus occultum TaxID=144539 RepID=A0A9N8VJI2_9GLOM|nr:5634_t:CDS:10 [Paraglomus occultum]